MVSMASVTSNVRETFDLVKFNTLELFKYDNFTKASCKNYGSSDQLTFIGRCGFNPTAFYLYRATNAGLSCTPLLCACVSIKRGVALVWQSPYPAV